MLVKHVPSCNTIIHKKSFLAYILINYNYCTLIRNMLTKIKFELSTDVDNLMVDDLLVGFSPIVSGFPQQ